jgi:hypothetical protein
MKDKSVDYKTNLYSIIVYTNYLLYFLVFLGLFSWAPSYLNVLQFFTQLGISLFLLYRFNPYHKVHFNELDQKIVFSAGFFILTTVSLNQLAVTYLNDIKRIIKKVV